MFKNLSSRSNSLHNRFTTVLLGPAALAFLPAVSLGAYWFGGEGALLVAATLSPLFYLLAGAQLPGTTPRTFRRDLVTGLIQRDGFKELADHTFAKLNETGQMSAIFNIQLEDFAKLVDNYGQAAADTVVQRSGERIVAVLRDCDHVARMSDFSFAICLEPMRRIDLELCIQLAGRLQAALEEPISIDGTSVYVSASVGFCQSSRSPEQSGAAWLNAASTALGEARRHGSSAIRAYSEEMRRRSETRAELREEVLAALENGEIQPWFQPQISTDTGLVTGFEALARWHHPARGLLTPNDFLPAIEELGQLERLAEVMMFHAFTALKAWDAAGLNVPQVGVNFAGSELNNPRLVDKIQWELDRFDLTPDRLAVEVLETVVASAPDDTITRNITSLGKLGCRIDLDDFGTGHASLAAISRFSVSRIKIDRSFVMKADRDQGQQRMISAILTMAERLGVETLAEGVETAGEHALLSQLGCDHVQGFGIARPMPFDKTIGWVQEHLAKLQDAPRIEARKSR